MVLDVASGEQSASDRVAVLASRAEVAVSRVSAQGGSFIEVENSSAYELDLSGWLLKSGTRYFSIPRSTFILPKSTLVFPASITGLEARPQDVVVLLYPNGTVAHVFEKDIAAKTVAFPSASASGNQTASVAKVLSEPRQSSLSPAPAAPERPKGTENEKIPASQEAAANQGGSEKGGSVVLWLIAAAILVMTAVAAVIVSPRRSPEESAAEQFTIIEDKTP